MLKNTKLLDILKGLSDNNQIQEYLFVHYGRLNQEIAVSTIQLIEKKMDSEMFDRNIITKTKTVCIEIIQNIIKHQTNHDTIFPYFIIGSNRRELAVFAGNVITDDSMKIISKSINAYQTIEKDKLKKYYLDSLRESAISPEGNAGMGLMDIVLKSNQQLSYEMKSLSGNLYSYDMSVVLNKQEVLA